MRQYIIQIASAFYAGVERSGGLQHQSANALRYRDRDFVIREALRLAHTYKRAWVIVRDADTLGAIAEFTIYE